LARIVRLVTAVVVGIIVVGIVLHLLGANGSNGIVSAIYDAARWLVGPFKGVFSPSGAKAQIAANYGLAAVVYAIVGGLISRVLAGMAGGGLATRRRRAGAV